MIDFLDTPIVEPGLPFYMTDGVGASPFAINSIAAMYSLAQVFFGTWLGAISDRVGRKLGKGLIYNNRYMII